MNQRIKYTLRKSKRARRMKLAVYRDGSVVVTTPPGAYERLAERFVHEKSAWLFAKLKFFAQHPEPVTPRGTRQDFLEHKKVALALITQKVQQLSRIYDVKYRRVMVKNQKTRWGSCSKKGSLSFNYRILFLSEQAQDYIVAHELCHLQEFNHSPKFWHLVAQISPNYKLIRGELKRSGFMFQ